MVRSKLIVSAITIAVMIAGVIFLFKQDIWKLSLIANDSAPTSVSESPGDAEAVGQQHNPGQLQATEKLHGMSGYFSKKLSDSEKSINKNPVIISQLISEITVRCGSFALGDEAALRHFNAPSPKDAQLYAQWKTVFEEEKSRCKGLTREELIRVNDLALAAAFKDKESPNTTIDLIYGDGMSNLPPGEQLQFMFDTASQYDTNFAVDDVLIWAAKKGLFSGDAAAASIIRTDYNRQSRFNDIVAASVRLASCQRSTERCGNNEYVQVTECLKAHNCAPNLRFDQFILQRMLTPNEARMAQQYANEINRRLAAKQRPESPNPTAKLN